MKGKKFAALAFFICMFLLPILTFALPAKQFSEIENRYLEEFPTLNLQTIMNRKFMNGFESYIADHFVGRDQWVAVKGYSEYAMGKRENNGIFLCNNALIEHLEEPNEEYTQQNIQGIRDFAQNTGKTPYLMLIPSASEIQQDRLPMFAQTWSQKDYTDSICSALEGVVTPIDLYGTLTEHKDDYIYYRTDHHWTTYGAYLAYQQLSNYLPLVSLEPESVDNPVSDSFLGTLYSKAGYRNVQADTINAYRIPEGRTVQCSVFTGQETKEYDSPYFAEKLEVKDKYSYFLGENQPIVTLNSNAGTGKKLLVFKDSYAHSLAPMLTESYDQITLVDLRYINGGYSEYIDVSQYDDVLMMYSVDVFAHQQNPSKLSNP